MRCSVQSSKEIQKLQKGHIVLHIDRTKNVIQLTRNASVVLELPDPDFEKSKGFVFKNCVEFAIHSSGIKSKFQKNDSNEEDREIDMEMIVAHCQKVDEHHIVEFSLRSLYPGERGVKLYEKMEAKHRPRIFAANYVHPPERSVSAVIPESKPSAHKSGNYLVVPRHPRGILSVGNSDSSISPFQLPSACQSHGGSSYGGSSNGGSSYGGIDAPRASLPAPRGGFHTRVVGSLASSSSSELIFPISR